MPILRLLTALGLTTLCALAPAQADEVAAKATYSVTLGGTLVANVEIRLSDSGKAYAMALDARITGLAQLVASGTAKVQSVGQSTRSGLVSQKFDMLTRAQGEDFTVNIEYAGKNVTAFIVSPPIINNIDRVALERRHLNGVNDMLAAFVLKGDRLGPGLCDRKMQIFTGVERFNVSMAYAKDDVATSKRTGYQGPVILCNIRYTPVSGHYTSSEITTYLAETGRILIWFAPLRAPGYFIPYRALLSTSVGDLSIVLTELEQ